MWRAPRVPYADGWRFLGHFARERFPDDILLADNGHYEVLPNAIRVLETRFFDASQTLQIIVGMVLLMASLFVAWRGGLRQLNDADTRAAAALMAVLGFCWLGNVRALAHANESVHAYAVTLMLLLGIGALLRRAGAPGKVDAVLAAGCGLLAALSFGSGIAVFVAFLAVATLRRAHWNVLGILATAAVLVMVLLRAGGAGASPELAPLAQADLALRWVAAPWLYAIWPTVDPSVAARIPVEGLREPVVALAQAWEQLFGPAVTSRWPHLALGALGVVWLGASTARNWRRGGSNGCVCAALGVAWFALAVGGMVAVVRAPYFEIHSDQLLAPRYVVWSSLFWAGLGVAWVSSTGRKPLAMVMTILVAIALLPSQVWMAQLAETMRQVAAQTAIAAAVGVLDPALPTGETIPSELSSALPAVRDAELAVFAWAETAQLGAPAMTQGAVVEMVDPAIETVDNLLGAAGRRVSFRTDATIAPRLLLVDDDDIVRGLAIRAGSRDDVWVGWMREPGPLRGVRAMNIAAD